MVDRRLHSSLIKMLEGNSRKVPKAEREKIQETIVEFIENYIAE